MLTFIRRTPLAFWFALVGVGFFLVVFLSRYWDFQSGFALILAFGYLLVALFSAIYGRATWIVAACLAALIAILEGGLVLLFFVAWLSGENPPGIAISHATGLVIAAAAGLSALLAARRRVPRPSGQVAAA